MIELERELGTFTVERSTGTHADVFAAVGLADLLSMQIGVRSDTVRLSGDASTFQVQVDPALGDDTLANLSIGPGYRFLRPKRSDPIPAGVSDVVTYEVERERAKRYTEARRTEYETKAKKLPPDPALEQAIRDDAPSLDWRQIQVMYALTNHASPNRVYAAIAAMSLSTRQRLVEAALRALARGEPPNATWKVDAVQLFNPMAAKGYARLKADSTDRNDKTKEHWTNPFVEWLRYRGYFQIACPFFQGAKGENIRVYTPVPANASLQSLKTAAAGLRAAPVRGAPPKADALAILWLSDALINASRQGQDAKKEQSSNVFGFDLSGLTPADVIESLTITNYQSLGSARAVSSLSTLAIPAWFPISSADDAAAWLEILDEHRRVVSGLDDKHSDEIGLLVGYRRFLERRGRAAVESLLDFMGGYGPFIVSPQ